MSNSRALFFCFPGQEGGFVSSESSQQTTGQPTSQSASQRPRSIHTPRSFSDARKKATSIKAFSIRAIRPRSLICDFYFVQLISCEGKNASRAVPFECGVSSPPRSRSALMPRPRIILFAVGRNFHVNAALSIYFRYLPPLRQPLVGFYCTNAINIS